jgi:hypothetical protein
MGSSGTVTREARGDLDASNDSEGLLPERLRGVVRRQPLLAVGAAGALGAALGGVLFSRLGRLTFIAAVGYVINELWHREGRLDIDGVIEKLSR